MPVEIQQVERDHYYLVGPALEFTLKNGEISRAVRNRDNNLAVDDRGTPAVSGLVR
jgi:hypothetical protein